MSQAYGWKLVQPPYKVVVLNKISVRPFTIDSVALKDNIYNFIHEVWFGGDTWSNVLMYVLMTSQSIQ